MFCLWKEASSRLVIVSQEKEPRVPQSQTTAHGSGRKLKADIAYLRAPEADGWVKSSESEEKDRIVMWQDRLSLVCGARS